MSSQHSDSDDYVILENIPQELRTPEVITRAIATSAYINFEFVPVEMMTEELLVTALGDGNNNDPNDDMDYEAIMLRDVPEALRTERVCRTAIKTWCHQWRFVPSHLKTDELRKLAKERADICDPDSRRGCCCEVLECSCSDDESVCGSD